MYYVFLIQIKRWKKFLQGCIQTFLNFNVYILNCTICYNDLIWSIWRNVQTFMIMKLDITIHWVNRSSQIANTECRRNFFCNHALNKFKESNEKQFKEEIKMLLCCEGFYDLRECFSDQLIQCLYLCLQFFLTYSIYLDISVKTIKFYSSPFYSEKSS